MMDPVGMPVVVMLIVHPELLWGLAAIFLATGAVLGLAIGMLQIVWREVRP